MKRAKWILYIYFHQHHHHSLQKSLEGMLFICANGKSSGLVKFNLSKGQSGLLLKGNGLNAILIHKLQVKSREINQNACF